MHLRTVIIVLVVCFFLFLLIQINRTAFDAYFDDLARSGELGARRGELGARRGELGARRGELGRQRRELGSPEVDPDFAIQFPPFYDEEDDGIEPEINAPLHERLNEVVPVEGVPSEPLIEMQREGIPDVAPQVVPVVLPVVAAGAVALAGLQERLLSLPPVLRPRTDIEARLPRVISRGQKACSIAIEELTGQEFKFNVRPSFLRSPLTGRNLELDIYSDNPAFRVAVEYNGRQHYIFPNYFHQDEAAFHSVVRHDVFKQKRCAQLGIYLITIPYTIPEHQIKEEIAKKLELRYRGLFK